MSIAVSAVVAPSRWLMLLLVLMSSCSMAIGVLMFFNGFPAMAGPAHADPWFVLRCLFAVTCIGGGMLAIHAFFCKRAYFHIDISGTGQIRLRKLEHPSPNGRFFTRQKETGYSPGPLQLLPESTLWPHLMVLRLQCELGRIHTLFVLPDTLSQTSFRMLSVACHWIAAHNIRAGSEKT